MCQKLDESLHAHLMRQVNEAGPVIGSVSRMRNLRRREPFKVAALPGSGTESGRSDRGVELRRLPGPARPCSRVHVLPSPGPPSASLRSHPLSRGLNTIT